jgi:hypothetical protein
MPQAQGGAQVRRPQGAAADAVRFLQAMRPAGRLLGLLSFIPALTLSVTHMLVSRCRDLKLDNTLLEACIVGLPRIKICDFGFAKRWGAAGDQMHTAIGTPVYMSPQVSTLSEWCCN